MIIYLFGPDSYRRRQKLNSILTEYQSKHSDLSVSWFDFENPDDFFAAKENVSQKTMFSVQKLIIIKNPFLLKPEKLIEDFRTLLVENESDKETTVLLSDEKNPPETFSFLLNKNNLHQEFELYSQAKLAAFISKEFKSREIKIAPDAIEFLAQNFEKDIWGLMNELNKISLLGKKEISLSDILSVGYYSRGANLFKYIDSIAAKKPVKYGLNYLEELFINQEDGAKIFNILASRPFIDFSLLAKLADKDIEIKSGRNDYETVLFELCL